jgi:hypothetical protein
LVFIAVLASGWLLYFMLSKLASRAIYYPLRYPAGDWNIQSNLGAEDRWITTADGVRLHAWWIAAAAESPATLFLHGNAGNVTYRGHHAMEIVRAGSSLLVLDYRGYGKSESSPSEEGLYADADAAYESLVRAGFAAEQIILHGESLGSAVAVDLAVRRGCRGVILEAPLASASKMAGVVLPLLGPLLVSGFDTEATIPRLRAPLLVIQGDRDEVVPYSQGQAVFKAAPQPKQFWTIRGGGHNNIVAAGGTEYAERLRAFYRSL